MLIHFVHPGQSYLPELAAYTTFLAARGHGACQHTSSDTVPADAQIVWWICGRVLAVPRHLRNAFHVHEYASASVPPYAWAKDRIKARLQPSPNYRIFQNTWVKQRLNFLDSVPCEYRDMGVPEAFLAPQMPPHAPEFDAVYLGDMHRLRGFLPLLRALRQAERTLLLVGEVPVALQAHLANMPHITFAGRVPQQDVPTQLARARCGLNLVPDQAPYNQQTSTKLLEYCAIGLPVISTDYAWVRQFENSSNARFAYLPVQATDAQYVQWLGNVLPEQVCNVPDMRAYAWQELLSRLHIWSRLEALP